MVRMLVTRPEPDASETAARLSALGIEPVVEPLLHSEMLPANLPDPAGFAALVLTSANALRALAGRGDIARFHHLKVFAVGDKTAGAARALGFTDVSSADGNAEDLVNLLAGANLTGPVLYPAARDRAGNLDRALARHGLLLITVELYAMAPVSTLSPPVRSALAADAIDAALFYSRRTAETFATVAPAAPGRRQPGMLCLSEGVAEPLIAAHFVRVALADHPSEEAMMGLALSFARDQKRGMIEP